MTQVAPGIGHGVRDLRIPNISPATPAQHDENWRALQNWARTVEGSPYDAAFYNVTCDGTRSAYTFPVPNIYTHLWYRIVGTSTSTAASLQLTFNGDATAAHYFYSTIAWLYAAVALTFSSANSIPIIGNFISDTSRMQMAQGIIGGYTNATFHKVISIQGSGISGSAPQTLGSAVWESIAPITSATVSVSVGNFAAGTSIQFGGIW